MSSIKAKRPTLAVMPINASNIALVIKLKIEQSLSQANLQLEQESPSLNQSKTIKNEIIKVFDDSPLPQVDKSPRITNGIDSSESAYRLPSFFEVKETYISPRIC